MNDRSARIDDFVNQLSDDELTLDPAELLTTTGADLDVSGLYSWWVDKAGAADLTRGLQLPVTAGIIYVGQAGASRPRSGSRSRSTLWLRLTRNHLGGNHRSSTLRRTLGSILASAEQWPAIDEATLTAWMCEHLRVAPVPVSERETLDSLESEVVAVLDAPFNLNKVPTNPMRQRLRALRREFAHLPTVPTEARSNGEHTDEPSHEIAPIGDNWTIVPPARELRGDEPLLHGTGSTVLDFWRFAMSDLRMNNVRGYLAEFLVARAVGANLPRVEWDAYDVLTPDGTRIEVKSSAYLQVWEQRRPSAISFTGLRGRTWSLHDGEASEPTYNADIYVFAVQTAMTHDSYEPLDVAQWDFYVLPRTVLEQLGQKSLGLATLQRLAGDKITYAELASAVLAAKQPGEK